jgi:hypothetical protein
MRQAAFALLILVSALFAAVSAEPLPAVSVYPSGDAIPENLLRISLRFADPPTGPVLSRIRLEDDDGALIDSPFLDQELWSPDRTWLTILLDPGRVKTGLIAHDLLGRALIRGTTVRLLVDGHNVRRWNVVDEKRSAPDPAKWRISLPNVGSLDTLRVSLDSPVDALDVDLIAVAAPDGVKLAGHASLEMGELIWAFTPIMVWNSGNYRLMIHPRLEDACGNEVGEAFEHAADSTGPVVKQALSIPFVLR